MVGGCSQSQQKSQLLDYLPDVSLCENDTSFQSTAIGKYIQQCFPETDRLFFRCKTKYQEVWVGTIFKFPSIEGIIVLLTILDSCSILCHWCDYLILQKKIHLYIFICIQTGQESLTCLFFVNVPVLNNLWGVFYVTFFELGRTQETYTYQHQQHINRYLFIHIFMATSLLQWKKTSLFSPPMYILNNEDNKRLFVGVTYLQLSAFGAFLKRILMVEKRAGDVRTVA